MPASAAEVENQELRRPMETLHEENQRLAAERDESSQRATIAHGELAQLRETVAVLREQLDAVPPEEQGRAHGAVAAAQSEVSQLRETIVALRDELEAVRVASEASVHQAMVAARDEVAELRSEERRVGKE